MSAYEKLARPIQKWVRDQGWSELRGIQTQAICAIFGSQDDLIVAASTAGGKTEAVFLPLISQVVDSVDANRSGFDLVYIGPLKALINDQQRRLEDICENTGLPVYPWHGDIPASIKQKAQKVPRGILLITPESLEALFVRKGTQIPRLFAGTSAVVIDELHTLLDSERGVQLRSLLARLELATSRRIRRIGLSATLGDMELARNCVRQSEPDGVFVIRAEGGEAELRLQLRGYVSGIGDADQFSTIDDVAQHLFEKLRGVNNLVFAGARNRVEVFSDKLRSMCERFSLPQEFYPHHANLSRDHREFVERRLKEARFPTTAICTSTLELGIDIGDVACVAQIGAPFTVAALRQRLGRSGRRDGRSVLRQYAIEAALDAKSNFSDRLRLGLIRAIAMIELMLEGWCEAPRSKSLHLSTLVHQILSVIAERGGASANRIFATLCDKGPFNTVDREILVRVLRRMGDPEVGLIEQSSGGLLLLGKTGERVVEHYTFYAVFKTPEEYRLIADGKELGTVPIDNVLAPGMTLIFSGRRWEIRELNDREKVVLVRPSTAGTPPVFGGDPGDIDDRVIAKMNEIFRGDGVPIYLDSLAANLLAEARVNFARMGFVDERIVAVGEQTNVLATSRGTVKTFTLALALRSFGFLVQSYDGFIEVRSHRNQLTLKEALAAISSGDAEELLGSGMSLYFDKFHSFLSEDLLRLDALSCKLDARSLGPMANELLNENSVG